MGSLVPWLAQGKWQMFAEWMRTEVYTLDTLCFISAMGHFQNTCHSIPICMLCPFISPANLQALLSCHLLHRSVSHSPQLRINTVFSWVMWVLCILLWNIPLTMFCLFPYQSRNIWKGRKVSWFPLFLDQHIPCYHISSREYVFVEGLKRALLPWMPMHYLPVWLQQPIFSWLHVVSLRPDLF